MQALTLVDGWPVDRAAVAVVGPGGVLAARGDLEWTVRLASVTKLFVAYGCLIARQEGVLDFDTPAGPPGATVRHLLAHASASDSTTRSRSARWVAGAPTPTRRSSGSVRS